MFPDLTRDDVFRLETPRLWLRWPRASDAAAIRRIAGAAEVAQRTASIPHPYPPGAAEAFILAARAANAVAAGEPGLALDLIDAAIVVAPRWANARMNRAMIHLTRHDIDRAVADLATTLTMEPRHIGAMGTLAAVAEAGGRKAEALKWLRSLARLDPRNPAVAADRMEKLTIEVEGREL